MNLDTRHSQLSEIMDFCYIEHFLTEWEHNFVIDVIIRIEETGALTEKQIATAKRIITKYEIYEGKFYRERYLPMKEE
jgi:hypothetical protein